MATSFAGQHRRFTVADVERMVASGVLRQDEHVELLDGELIEMPPQGPLHADVATDLRDAFGRAYGAGFLVREAKPVVAGAEQLPEPDISVFRREGGRARGQAHPDARDAVLLVEIAQTSLAIDRDKARIYAAAGAAVYWIVDLTSSRLEVHEEPQPDGRYRTVRVLAGSDVVLVPGTSIEWRVRDMPLR